MEVELIERDAWLCALAALELAHSIDVQQGRRAWDEEGEVEHRVLEQCECLTARTWRELKGRL